MYPLVPSTRLLRYLAIANDSRIQLQYARPLSNSSRGYKHCLRPGFIYQHLTHSNVPKSRHHALSQRHSSRHSLRTFEGHCTPPFRSFSRAPSPPDTTNYYSLFPETLKSGGPPNGPFLVNTNDLRKEYLKLQSLHHPDKYPPDQKRQADALSALLGEAFRTLTDPLRCAQYLLLTKYDVDMNSEIAKSSTADMEMLSTIMEAQEAATDARTQEEVDSLNTENDRRIEECIIGLTEAFQTDDVVKARQECTQLKYWTSLRDALRNWEPGKDVRIEH